MCNFLAFPGVLLTVYEGDIRPLLTKGGLLPVPGAGESRAGREPCFNRCMLQAETNLEYWPWVGHCICCYFS